ncbi:hypothetical protein [Streptomyces scabiei]|uniref:hypothetical protein n=1 Tax=Streptomyces scabiei TaxID=1930 RepID=UPI0029A48D53|nr:hypothetical protein [Streptomyces scabiei]MDX2689294.1 hypothetical protein [Streptomyces scabiei]
MTQDSKSICFVCGAMARYDIHHVSGRANNSHYTMPVCSRCNQKTLLYRQQANTLPLDKEFPRDSVTADFSDTVGTFLIIEAISDRWGCPEAVGRVRSVINQVTEFSRHLSPSLKIDHRPIKILKTVRGVVRENTVFEAVAGIKTMAAFLFIQNLGYDHVISKAMLKMARNPSETLQIFSESYGYENLPIADQFRKMLNQSAIEVTGGNWREMLAESPIKMLDHYSNAADLFLED